MTTTAELRTLAMAATKGKWCQFHPGFCDEAKGTPCTDWDTSHDMSAIIDGKRKRIATFKHADDAAWIAAANPAAVLALLDRIEVLEKALAFYGDSRNYHIPEFLPGSPTMRTGSMMRQLGVIEADAGKSARAALGGDNDQ